MTAVPSFCWLTRHSTNKHNKPHHSNCVTTLSPSLPSPSRCFCQLLSLCMFCIMFFLFVLGEQRNLPPNFSFNLFCSALLTKKALRVVQCCFFSPTFCVCQVHVCNAQPHSVGEFHSPKHADIKHHLESLLLVLLEVCTVYPDPNKPFFRLLFSVVGSCPEDGQYSDMFESEPTPLHTPFHPVPTTDGIHLLEGFSRCFAAPRTQKG